MVNSFRLLVVILLIFYIVPPVTSAGSQIPPEYLLNQKTTVTLTGLPSGAKVYVDQDKAGKTPTYPSHNVQFITSPGKHTLKVQAGGYQPWSQTININSGSQITIEVNLIPIPARTPTTTQPTFQKRPTHTPNILPGTLTVVVSPSHAGVTLDGTPYKKGVPQSLQSGNHTIEVKAAGYLSKTEQIQINWGDHLNLNIALEKDPKTIAPEDLVLFEATSDPTGASVYIDGQLNGTTPCVITTSLGQHTVTFRMEGYQDRVETIDFYKNAAGRTSPQKVFWMLTEGGASSSPGQKEAVIRETPGVTPSTTIARASAHSEEPTDVLQYVIYFVRGLLGGNH